MKTDRASAIASSANVKEEEGGRRYKRTCTEVFRLVFVCLDAMDKEDIQNAKARSPIGKLLADVVRFATVIQLLQSLLDTRKGIRKN